MYERRRRGGGIWLLAFLVFLAGPYLGPALAAVPSVTRPAAPHAAGRVAPPPAGLSFTTSHGCQPAQDWRSPKLDPRVRLLLVRVAAAQPIRVSCLRTGHSWFVKGTRRVSNHSVWRAVDIDQVAGRPVSPGDLAAKRLALAIGQGRYGVVPSEVGSPWQVGRRPWFSDEGHQRHLHVGFGR